MATGLAPGGSGNIVTSPRADRAVGAVRPLMTSDSPRLSANTAASAFLDEDSLFVISRRLRPRLSGWHQAHEGRKSNQRAVLSSLHDRKSTSSSSPESRYDLAILATPANRGLTEQREHLDEEPAACRI